MPKDEKAPVVEGAAPSPLAPAAYRLAGINPDDKRIHIPSLGREYDVAELTENLGLLELLHSQGWPHVVKTK